MENEKLNNGAALCVGLILSAFALIVAFEVGNHLAPVETRKIDVVDKDVIQIGGKFRRFVWSVESPCGEKFEVSFKEWKSTQIGQQVIITERKFFNY